MGRGARAAARQVSRSLRRRHTVHIATAALDELSEAIAYIGRDSPTNAGVVVEAIAKRIEGLRPFPRSGPPDENAPVGSVPAGIEARVAHTDVGFTIRYLFPVAVGVDSEAVLVLSIRRSARLPLDDAEFVARFMEEQARLARQ